MIGAAGPMPGGTSRARGQHKWGLGDSHGPGVLAKPSVGEALGIAARLVMLGATNILTTPMGMPVIHTSYLSFRSAQRPQHCKYLEDRNQC